MKTQTFNIALPQNLVRKVDQAAQKEYRNRSELIREALRVYLKDMEEWGEIFEYGKKQGKRAGVKNQKGIDQVVNEFRHAKHQ